MNYNYRKKPMPENVSDIYDPQVYSKWLNYTMENMRFSLIKKTLSTVIIVVLLLVGFFGTLEGFTSSWFNSPTLEILFSLAIALVMTGLIIKFKNITIGGLLLLAFVVYNHVSPGLNFLLMNIYGIAFGMLIPGISLYRFKETK